MSALTSKIIPAAGVTVDRGPGERRRATVDIDGARRMYGRRDSVRKLTVHEARKVEQDEWLDDESPVDKLYTTITPVVMTDEELKQRDRDDAVKWLTSKYDDAAEEDIPRPSPNAISPAQAAELRSQFQRVAKGAEDQAAAAKASGDPAKEAKAAEAVAETNQLAASLAAKGVEI